MNRAVEMDGMHPIIRLIRGLTYVHLSCILAQFDQGIKDSELVVSWVEKQLLNEEYSDLIADQAFISQVHYGVGEVYQRRGEYDRARVFFKKVTASLPDPRSVEQLPKAWRGLNYRIECRRRELCAWYRASDVG